MSILRRFLAPYRRKRGLGGTGVAFSEKSSERGLKWLEEAYRIGVLIFYVETEGGGVTPDTHTRMNPPPPPPNDSYHI
jgi:hypothetical protein